MGFSVPSGVPGIGPGRARAWQCDNRFLTIGKCEPTTETAVRDCEIGALDHFLSSSGWDQSEAFGDTVEPTSDRLVGLSLRELPWLLQGATERGFTLREVMANASERPGEPNEFAQA